MVWSILAGIGMTVGKLVAQEVGNPDQGLRLAHTLCAECHLVDKLPEQSPNLIAPSFEHIAKTPGMNSAALTAALRTSHESMPNIIIKGTDLSDVIAYILLKSAALKALLRQRWRMHSLPKRTWQSELTVSPSVLMRTCSPYLHTEAQGALLFSFRPR